MRARDRLSKLGRFVRGVSRGLRLGQFLPGAASPRSAPLGSEERPIPLPSPPPGGLVLRRHRLPLRGLDAPLRVLQLSDLHLRGPAPWLDGLLAHLGGQRPDLLVLTGDMLTLGWQEAVLRRFLDGLPEAPLGRYAVMGNWEHWAGASPERYGAILGQHRIRLLRDEVVEAGPLRLAGCEDLLAGAGDPVALRRRLVPGLPTLVLAHCPALLGALAGPGVDLVLSGHAHGGQVDLPGLGPLWVPRGTGPQVGGWYQQGPTLQYVSRGLGWSIAPLRWRCPSELVELELLPRTAS